MVIPCAICVTVIVVASIGVYFSGIYLFSNDEEYFQVFVNSREIVFETDERFLSVALDTSFMRCYFHKLTERDWERLETLSILLSPAYLRVGGTDADRTVFDAKKIINVTADCDDSIQDEVIIITGTDWLKLNDFARKSNLRLVFALNVLLRKNSHWDDTNARELLKFSETNALQLDFQLGNEPNFFRKTFNITIPGSELAEDFHRLKNLLKKSKTYRNSKLIGPDVTRPKFLKIPSLDYLDEFLSKGNVVDVVSWHQYYLNGREASLSDFLNPDTFDVLPPQIEYVWEIVRKHVSDKPVWISETSSAYGGGAPGLSDRFVASFLWVDKLGLSGRWNISVVIRQSLVKNNYALIGRDLNPNPDFWISVLYKHLVGRRVLDVKVGKIMSLEFLRFYAHCIAFNATINGSVVIYGMNLSNKTESFFPYGIGIIYPVYSFIFQPKNNDLRERTVLLNNNELHNDTVIEDMIKMREEVKYPLKIPPYGIGFWVLKEFEETACKR